jgi:hypothetical protein
MVRGGVAAGALVTPAAAAIAFAVRGRAGGLAVVAAFGLVLANFAISGAILTLAARRYPLMFPAIAMPSYALRMLSMLFAMQQLRQVSAIDHLTFAVTFGAGVVALLVYECWLYTKTPWLALTFSPTKETTT